MTAPRTVYPFTIIREIEPLEWNGLVPGSSRVFWHVKDDATVSAETSLDDGGHWSPVANGVPVPGLNPGDHLNKVRAGLTAKWTRAEGPWPLPDFGVQVNCEPFPADQPA